ncbi:MAG: chromosome partitioning protein [Variovorax sp.]|nr:chromosome partitioning protein [Variovorax sp.]
MAQIFCITNQKGGVGKTTVTVNLAAGLAKVGQRVLMIDLDPQGNATMGSGIDKREIETTVYDVLLESASVADARIRSEKCGYDVLGANRELAGAEIEMVALDRRERRLRTALVSVANDYDYVLIDCPPSLSLLTLNGLCAAHGVIVPMQCEYFALEGLTDLVNTIKQVHANLNKNLQIVGLLRVMFDPRITLQQQVSEQLKAHFGDKVFDTMIPRNVRLAEAPSYGLPGVIFDPAAKGSQAFVAFANEMVARLAAKKGGRAPARSAQPAAPLAPVPDAAGPEVVSSSGDAALLAAGTRTRPAEAEPSEKEVQGER